MRPDAMARLRAANPITTEADRGHDELAQVALQRILTSPHARTDIVRRRTVGRRGLIVVLALLLLGAGGALAASDPMGWWSSNPGEAHYRVNPVLSSPTPRAQQLRCHPSGDARFACTPATTRCYQIGHQAPHCGPSGHGLPYARIDTIRKPPRDSLLGRPGFTRAIAQALATGKVTRKQADSFRSDLAAVSGNFFTELRLASRYGTYGAGGEIKNGRELVPPVGVPPVLVCAGAGRLVSCRDINGDANTPIGAGVYSAEPGRGWRWIKAPRYIGGLPPGIHFTRAEDRLLIDILRLGTTQQSTGSVHATPVPVTHVPPPRTQTASSR